MKLWDQLGMGPVRVKLPAVIEQMIEAGLAIIGTPGKVADKIQAQISSAGANDLVARFAFGDLPHAAACRSVDLFGRPCDAGTAARGLTGCLSTRHCRWSLCKEGAAIEVGSRAPCSRGLTISHRICATRGSALQ